MTKRVLLGNDASGVWTGFRSTLPGYDARAVGPTEYSKLGFDSSWNALESIHQAGTVRIPASGFGSTVSHYESKRVTFTDLGYLPMVSARRKSALSAGTVYGDEWWTGVSGGNDIYRNFFIIFPYSNSFRFNVCPFPARSSVDGPQDDFPGPWFLDYIVWKIPIVPSQVYT